MTLLMIFHMMSDSCWGNEWCSQSLSLQTFQMPPSPNKDNESRVLDKLIRECIPLFTALSSLKVYGPQAHSNTHAMRNTWRYAPAGRECAWILSDGSQRYKLHGSGLADTHGEYAARNHVGLRVAYLHLGAPSSTTCRHALMPKGRMLTTRSN